METSAVRQRVTHLIERAKRSASERRARNDEAGRAYDRFLEQIAIPLFRQIAGALLTTDGIRRRPILGAGYPPRADMKGSV